MEDFMKKIEGVIFDMDGVLFDTERICFSFWKEVLKKYGYNMTKKSYISLMGRNSRDGNEILIKMYGENLPISKICYEIDISMLKYLHNNGAHIKPGVYELLNFLIEKGYKIALATSNNREKTIDLLEMAGIRDRFKVIICGDDVIKSKPDPEIFLRAAEKLKSDPKNCIVLEDSPSGIEAAYNAGMMAINIPDLKEPDERTEVLAYKICRSLLEVRDYLKEFDKEKINIRMP